MLFLLIASLGLKKASDNGFKPEWLHVLFLGQKSWIAKREREREREREGVGELKL